MVARVLGSWCEREELLRRLAVQRKLLERAAVHAMASADAHFERSSGKHLHSAASAAVRAAIVKAHAAEVKSAKLENRSRDDGLYMRAVEEVRVRSVTRHSAPSPGLAALCSPPLRF